MKRLFTVIITLFTSLVAYNQETFKDIPNSGVPISGTCAGATTLACGTTNQAGTTVGEANVEDGTACAIADYGVWYTFEGDGQETTITVDPNGSGYDLEIALVSGSCGSMTTIACIDNSTFLNPDAAEGFTMIADVGTTYYLYIAHYSESSSNTGTFLISRSCTAAAKEDCAGAIPICGDATFSGNSSGDGTFTDLNASNDGCLSGERESSWYSFDAAIGGTLEFKIRPTNGTDDYDFAIWGPYANSNAISQLCPVTSAPVRCSYAAGAPPAAGTGIESGAGDNSEGSGGDHIVESLSFNDNEVYILVVDNFSTSTDPFDMDITLSDGLVLNCFLLPVELLNFKGEAMDKTNNVHWQTETEINNDYFELQKSYDGTVYITLDKIQGNGNSYVLNSYSYIDESPANGITYYRLKQVDFDGSYSYSKTIAVSNIFESIVEFFPNPTQGKLNLNFNSLASNSYIVSVSDISKVLFSRELNVRQGSSSLQLDEFQDLAQGMYFITVTDNSGKVIKTDKIIKY